MSTLLPFHKSILEEIHDPATSELVVLARGLGLRRIVCTLMKIYDSPKNLVLLVNATPEEESEIGEELGIMGCRKPGLRIIGYETGSKERQELYKRGGLISVTSRILVVDMLQSDIPIDMITGILVLHAEKVTPLVLEAFIVRLYREKNQVGFLKAFTDQPEHITSGLSPLKNIMKELQLRKTHIYPRFHEAIKKSLERRRADVVELFQELTEPMSEIHHAVIQCMTSTLSEIKRSNTTLDLDDLNVENAYFRFFDVIVRRQLDPVWHKVGPKTKQLVSDLGTLRRLLYYLISYDPLQFHAYLETLITSNTVNAAGGIKQHQSPWLLTDAANTIFQVAKRRCYLTTSTSNVPTTADPTDDDEAWEALNDVDGATVSSKEKQKATDSNNPTWVPAGMDPVLEELPKWDLLSEILDEIEGEIIRQETLRKPFDANQENNLVLIMSSSTRTCNLLSEYLSSMDPSAPRGTKGRSMMLRKLRLYLWWKRKLGERKGDGKAPFMPPDSRQNNELRREPRPENSAISEAMKQKDQERAERTNNRRRVRGGGTHSAGRSQPPPPAKSEPKKSIMDDPENFLEFWEDNEAVGSGLLVNSDVVELGLGISGTDFDAHYGLLTSEKTVLLRAYSEDSDDRMLAELQPKFIIMVEPNMEFVRRVEVYRSSNPGLGLRVYHMVYGNSCEEHKYLAGVRREKESFEKLIRERGTMLLPILDHRDASNPSDAIIKTISSRVGGGRKELNTEPSKVIVDMREFRSTLPSLLHASNLLVIPATLTVGDYILTPDICVERKSLPDLVSSFNSGRLYTQCEWMCANYKYPLLLIEFEEDKAFSLELVSDLKSYAKSTGKYPAKKNQDALSDTEYRSTSVQSKLVLLTLSFPRVRIIWSSSPYATADIFNDLKMNSPEPDPTKAIAIGADGDPEVGAGVNIAAEDLLRSLPGITANNVKHVASKVRNVRELCEMSLPQVQDILGTDPGKKCWDFMHHGEKSA
ncbi:hypothetical protein BD779DRAFT_1453779 [Infundibulicybe gibba]|nr:hypothetical protein BD779DRAFT_1453779 [Infundibulicybe gibba]